MQARRNSGLVTVFGGSGFVGRYGVRALAKDGWRIRAASRRPDLAGHLQPMGGVGQIMSVQANLRYPQSIAAAVEGADAVVNAAGSWPSGRQTYEAMNVDGPAAIAKAAQAAGVKRFVHVSAIGADSKASARYSRTKAAGEAAVLAAFPGAVILRPSLVFGPEDELFNRFAAMAVMSPFLPLVGGGHTKFQPVFAGDLGLAIAAGLDGSAKPGTVYEIGGPEVMSFRQILDKTQEWTGRRRWYMPMPFWLAKLTAILTWPLPNAVRPMTYDQVRLLQSDNVVGAAAAAEARTLAGLGIVPHSAASLVPLYLERFAPRGQFEHYRG
jgi:NADH dehydrogenase